MGPRRKRAVLWEREILAEAWRGERERERDCALSNQLTMCGFYGFHNIYNYVIQNYNSFFFL